MGLFLVGGGVDGLWGMVVGVGAVVRVAGSEGWLVVGGWGVGFGSGDVEVVVVLVG